jgi:uncharacterized protein
MKSPVESFVSIFAPASTNYAPRGCGTLFVSHHLKLTSMKRILLILFLAIPFGLLAQNETFKGEHFIEVTGTAQMEIEPNEIFMAIRLREFEENKTKVPLEKLEKDFMAALKDAGIDRKRLELADAGSRIGSVRKKTKDAFREKTYQLKLTSAGELEKFLASLEPVKVDYVDIIKLSHSDLDKLKVDLKIKALQAAKTKADYLLRSIGAETGKPLMIRDWEMEPEHPVMNQQLNMRMQKADGDFDMAEEPQIGFRKIKLQAQLQAQFEIK